MLPSFRLKYFLHPSSYSSLPWGNQCSAFCHKRIVLTSLEFHINGITHWISYLLLPRFLSTRHHLCITPKLSGLEEGLISRFLWIQAWLSEPYLAQRLQSKWLAGAALISRLDERESVSKLTHVAVGRPPVLDDCWPETSVACPKGLSRGSNNVDTWLP